MDTFQSVASRIGGLQERSDDYGTPGIMGSELKTVSSPFHRVGDLDRTAPSWLFLPGSRRTQPYLTFVGDQRQAAAFNCAQIPDTFQAQVNAFAANTRIQCENFLDFRAKCIESDADSGINFSKIQTVEDFWGVAIAKSGDITHSPGYLGTHGDYLAADKAFSQAHGLLFSLGRQVIMEFALPGYDYRS